MVPQTQTQAEALPHQHHNALSSVRMMRNTFKLFRKISNGINKSRSLRLHRRTSNSQLDSSLSSTSDTQAPEQPLSASTTSDESDHRSSSMSVEEPQVTKYSQGCADSSGDSTVVVEELNGSQSADNLGETLYSPDSDKNDDDNEAHCISEEPAIQKVMDGVPRERLLESKEAGYASGYHSDHFRVAPQYGDGHHVGYHGYGGTYPKFGQHHPVGFECFEAYDDYDNGYMDGYEPCQPDTMLSNQPQPSFYPTMPIVQHQPAYNYPLAIQPNVSAPAFYPRHAPTARQPTAPTLDPSINNPPSRKAEYLELRIDGSERKRHEVINKWRPALETVRPRGVQFSHCSFSLVTQLLKLCPYRVTDVAVNEPYGGMGSPPYPPYFDVVEFLQDRGEASIMHLDLGAFDVRLMASVLVEMGQNCRQLTKLTFVVHDTYQELASYPCIEYKNDEYHVDLDKLRQLGWGYFEAVQNRSTAQHAKNHTVSLSNP